MAFLFTSLAFDIEEMIEKNVESLRYRKNMTEVIGELKRAEEHKMEGKIIETRAGKFYWNYENDKLYNVDRPNKIEGEMKYDEVESSWEVWLYP